MLKESPTLLRQLHEKENTQINQLIQKCLHFEILKCVIEMLKFAPVQKLAPMHFIELPPKIILDDIYFY